MNFDPNQLLRTAQENNQGEIDRIAKNLGVTRLQLGHEVIKSIPWPLIDRLLPAPGLNYLTGTGWIESLRRNSAVNGNGAPIPWLTYPAIEFLEPLVKKSWKVFEWGTGNSTRWWATQVQEVVAVENDPVWIQSLQADLPSNVRLLCLPEAQEYIHAIDAFPDHYFDAVIVDGIHRTECARQMQAKLSPQGVLIFDNSDWQANASAIRDVQKWIPCRLDFWGLIPIYFYKNCTSIFLRDPSILSALEPPCTKQSILGSSCQQIIDRLQPTAGPSASKH